MGLYGCFAVGEDRLQLKERERESESVEMLRESSRVGFSSSQTEACREKQYFPTEHPSHQVS